MNKKTYMAQLKRLLGGIPEAEREEALQYYEDYFEDAGIENEEEVISQLGSPEKLAENIIRDVSGNGYDGLYDESVRKKPMNSVVKYGETFTNEESASGQTMANGSQQQMAGGLNMNQASGMTAGAISGGMYNNMQAQNTAGYNRGQGYGNNQRQSNASKSGSGAKTAILILTSPIWATLLFAGCIILFALLIAWFAILIAVGAVTVALFIAAVSLIFSGAMAMSISGPIGLAVVGCGCIIIGFALLFLMLLVALAGIVTPAIFRGLGSMFRGNKG